MQLLFDSIHVIVNKNNVFNLDNIHTCKGQDFGHRIVYGLQLSARAICLTAQLQCRKIQSGDRIRGELWAQIVCIILVRYFSSMLGC